jgi:DNA repair exonuclease SbcCD ATPase subunit
LRQEIRDLKDKLKARDEEVSDLKKHGDNPLSNPPFSPTNSVEASTVEVATLKKKLKEKEQEVQNLKAQVGAVEGVLKQGQHLHKESEKLKQEIEKLKQDKQTLQDHSKKQSRTAEAERARLQDENDTLKQEVADEKRSAQNILAAEQERISRADSAIQKELHRLKEETHQKDLLLQSVAEEDEKINARLQDLQAQLAKAQAWKCLPLNRNLKCNKLARLL